MIDFESKPMNGLPGPLPEGEKLLRQVQPDFRSVWRHVYHADKVAGYFGLLFVWSFYLSLRDGGTLTEAMRSSLWLLPAVGLALAILAILAWFTVKTTVYTITTERVVMRYGMAIPMIVNLSFKAIEAIDLKSFRDGTSDISLTLTGNRLLSYFHLWPHARRWHFTDPKPTLRSIANAEPVAEALAGALARHSSTKIHVTKRDDRRPSQVGSPAAA